mmetsp:Transcript_53993/g.131097  ORF Transcript_53993/g.131097 Transcript_53993/m.131097 type:complete len:207 (+) Transcript_53993:141-761(+)|eukprot:CAMPEP_0113440860 /NCGR_PEP_ID=MMETSP0014_2-20120614/779_1 /TAXON_ID=2857 /ORGANISM="Nitzschia sp." /LENGTH=206 /DNA_ID=CAMNT_0000331675 /DNA_START=104 /DNA_END=724 /DNA_ORIENTATION=- /assembly_acc=CAM_ASM_000159
MAAPPKKFVKNSNGIVVLNPEYQKWKNAGGGAKTSKSSSSSSSGPKTIDPIDKMVVEIKVLQGQGLVAKDRNLLGKKTTSDPYVDIFLLSGSGAPGTRYQKTKIGTTKTIPKNLNPVWNYTNSVTIPYLGNAKCALVFHIFDHDKFSEPDSMGIVKVPLKWNDIQGKDAEPKFYQVPPDSAKNATGQIEVGMKSYVHRLQGMKAYC